MYTPQQWITQQVTMYGREECLNAFQCDDEMLDQALAGDKAAVYQLAIARNKQARAYLDAHNKGTGKQKLGLPTAALSKQELVALVQVVYDVGAPTFCQRAGVTEPSLGKALSGRAVALHTLSALRSALDNGGNNA